MGMMSDWFIGYLHLPTTIVCYNIINSVYQCYASQTTTNGEFWDQHHVKFQEFSGHVILHVCHVERVMFQTVLPIFGIWDCREIYTDKYGSRSWLNIVFHIKRYIIYIFSSDI